MDTPISAQIESAEKMDLEGLRVGLLYWNNYNAVRNLEDVFAHMGFETTIFPYNTTIPEGLDVIFVRGPYGSLAPLGKQLTATPAHRRPAFVYVMVEPLPHPGLPEWLRRAAGWSRSAVERIAYRQAPDGVWKAVPSFPLSMLKAYRFNYYGDLMWMQREGILTVLGIPSRWNVDFLRQRGFDPLYLPLSIPKDPTVNFRNERDIPVLWLGKPGSGRRARILKRVREDLKQRGVELMVIDGIEHPYVFGKKRDLLLSRTKIVLNILRNWWDDNSMRYVLSMPKGALVVGEPTLPHTAFVPGVHLVQAPIEQIADQICYYLEHEEERLQIVERAYEEITRYSPVDIMHAVFERAVRQRQSGLVTTSMFVERLPQGASSTK